MKIPWRKTGLPDEADVIRYDAYDDGVLVGVLQALTDGDVVYLTDLYVAETHRRKGVGTRLMEQLLRGWSTATIVLLTTDATEFYERCGFTPRTAMIRRPQ